MPTSYGPKRKRGRSDEKYVFYSARFHVENDKEILDLIEGAMSRGRGGKRITFKETVVAMLAQANDLDVGDLINLRFSPRELRELAAGVGRYTNADLSDLKEQVSELAEMTVAMMEQLQTLRTALEAGEFSGQVKPEKKRRSKKDSEIEENMLRMITNASQGDWEAS